MSFSSDMREELTGLTGGSAHKKHVRKCFIDGGTLANPAKSYHLAFTLQKRGADKLAGILSNFGLSPKTLAKNGQFVVYLKDADEISDVIKIMGASKSLLAFESERVKKDLRNTLNRHVNCETANINKTVTAAQAQIDAIQLITNEAGIKSLSKPLRDVAMLRQAHETASLSEIGEMLTPPISKSGVNHRLRKICEIAEDMERLK